jgi:hypothetical protein
MTPLRAHGVALALPAGWEGRITRRTAVNPAERHRAVVHAASFPLPEERGDFGVGVTDLMRPGDVFVTLFEYGPESVGTPLFATQGVPRVHAALFTNRRLQRPLPGQLGCQLFFTAHGRPFCLYVVASGRTQLHHAITQVNSILGTLELVA